MTEKISLRDVTEDDCHDLWIWRNHPHVRENSFNSQEVKFDEHQAWFRKVMGDQNVKIYIAENDRRLKVGQIRFDKKDEVLISINLNPDFLGQGLGNRLIAMSTTLFLQQNPGVRTIIAQILEGNEVSRKAFQKAGYHLIKSDLVNGKRACVFSFEAGV